MDRSPDQRITGTVGQEICVRENIKAMMTGEIAPLGSHYVLTLNAVNCATGDSLAREQVEAESKEEVLVALGKAVSSMRGKLGESLSSIERFDAPIEQATTSSLEALKAFSQGDAQRDKGRETESIPFFERALELDPNFALAYARLGTIHRNHGELERATEYYKQAFALRERVSEREKFYISSWYYSVVTGEFDKALRTYELWMQTYPRDPTPWGNIIVFYGALGQFDKALEAAQEVMRLDPNSQFSYQDLGGAFLALNRFEEAKAVAEKQIAQGLENEWAHTRLYVVAFVQGDTEAMARHAEWMSGKPEEPWMVAIQGHAAIFSGKLQEARKLYRLAVELAQQHNRKEEAASTAAIHALWEAALGNQRRAREQAAAALAIAPGLEPQVVAAKALAWSVDLTQAQRLADDLGKRYPTFTLVNNRDIPTIRALVELQRGNPANAIELLKVARQYELGGGPGAGAGLQAIYVRGQAYLQLGAGAEAAAEFRKILDHRGIAPVSPLHSLARLGLARAHALAGDPAGARRAYQDFLALWKDADSDIPLLQEAKAEYAKLR
jgi:tetratricopeptide (TPR) repeat protein